MYKLIEYLQAAPVLAPPEDIDLSFLDQEFITVPDAGNMHQKLSAIVSNDDFGNAVSVMPFGVLRYVILAYLVKSIQFDETVRTPVDDGVLPTAFFIRFSTNPDCDAKGLLLSLNPFCVTDLVGISSAIHLCEGKTFSMPPGYSLDIWKTFPTIWSLQL